MRSLLDAVGEDHHDAARAAQRGDAVGEEGVAPGVARELVEHHRHQQLAVAREHLAAAAAVGGDRDAHRLALPLDVEALGAEQPVQQRRHAVGAVGRRQGDDAPRAELAHRQVGHRRGHVVRLVGEDLPEAVEGRRVVAPLRERHHHADDDVVALDLPQLALHEAHADARAEALEALVPLVADDALVDEDARLAAVRGDHEGAQHRLAEAARQRDHDAAAAALGVELAARTASHARRCTGVSSPRNRARSARRRRARRPPPARSAPARRSAARVHAVGLLVRDDGRRRRAEGCARLLREPPPLVREDASSPRLNAGTS